MTILGREFDYKVYKKNPNEKKTWMNYRWNALTHETAYSLLSRLKKQGALSKWELSRGTQEIAAIKLELKRLEEETAK